CSYPDNYHPDDWRIAEKQMDLYDILREEHHYELKKFPCNYRGTRIRRDSGDSADETQERQKEKCVDIALATDMLYFAALPYAYDIAIAVVGDLDFKPVLQAVRHLGKRVAIASLIGHC